MQLIDNFIKILRSVIMVNLMISLMNKKWALKSI